MKKSWRVFCDEPYRLFFPLGIGMGIFGASHWLVYALGLVPAYSGSFHAAVQVQLYMTSFVVGFLATAVPRFSATFPARNFEVAGLAALILAVFASLISGRPVQAQGFFIATLVFILFFVARRFMRRAVQYPPVQFVWIPTAVLHGVCGAALMGLAQSGCIDAGFLGTAKPMLNQGYLLSVVLGVGGFLGPRLMGSRELPNPEGICKSLSAFRARQIGVQVFCGLLFFISFWLEGARLGTTAYVLRAAVAVFILVKERALVLAPQARGLFPRLVWLSFWMVACGLWAAALLPRFLVTALHVVFIGGFSLLTFAVSTMVVLSHSGEGERLHGPCWILRITAFFVPLALLFRVASSLTPTHYFTVLGAAAFLWILAAVGWFFFAAPFLMKIPPRDLGHS